MSNPDIKLDDRECMTLAFIEARLFKSSTVENLYNEVCFLKDLLHLRRVYEYGDALAYDDAPSEEALNVAILKTLQRVYRLGIDFRSDYSISIRVDAQADTEDDDYEPPEFDIE